MQDHPILYLTQLLKDEKNTNSSSTHIELFTTFQSNIYNTQIKESSFDENNDIIIDSFSLDSDEFEDNTQAILLYYFPIQKIYAKILCQLTTKTSDKTTTFFNSLSEEQKIKTWLNNHSNSIHDHQVIKILKHHYTKHFKEKNIPPPSNFYFSIFSPQTCSFYFSSQKTTTKKIIYSRQEKNKWNIKYS